MNSSDSSFPIGLTFDDVLLIPGYGDFHRSDIDLSTKLSRNLSLSLPFVSAPMDTVTESGLAIALGKIGGIGIIHRNFSIIDQAKEVKKVKREKVLVGAAIGAGKGFEERVETLVAAGVDALVVDSADGFKDTVIETTAYIKKHFLKVDVIAGNVATYDGAQALIDAGADAIRVGMGPGAICTTRVISGIGVPQITAIMETARAGKKAGVPIIADGGIKYSGDMIKALAAGASTVMMGSYFASCLESPGKVFALTRQYVPRRFQSIFDNKKELPGTTDKNGKTSKGIVVIGDPGSNGEVYYFKEYRGMGSIGAMKRGSEVKSEGEFHGKSYKDRVLVAEGVEGLVPVKGTVKELLDQAIGGIRSGMYHVGAKSMGELWKKAQFIQITQASLNESHPHDVLITNPGENY